MKKFIAMEKNNIDSFLVNKNVFEKKNLHKIRIHIYLIRLHLD